MTSVGVRELRQNASELLRRVERGETIEITDRGRPVAVLAPLPSGGALERLKAGGEIESPATSTGELPGPVVSVGTELPSVALGGLRSDEH